MEDEETGFKKAQQEVKKQKSEEQVKKEIQENYKIGIEYYKDIEEYQD